MELKKHKSIRLISSLLIALLLISMPLQILSVRADEEEEGVDYSGGAQAFVERLYVDVMGREGDTAGVEHWSNLLRNGELNSAQIAFDFFFSEEFINKNLDDNSFITLLYSVFMEREASVDEVNYWIDKMTSEEEPVYRDTILWDFINSDEWANKCALYGIFSGGSGTVTIVPPINDGIKAFITSLYADCLGREPDEDGFNFWCEKLATLRTTGTELAFDFFFSDEFINRTRYYTEEDIISIFYKVFLNREVEQGGLDYWLDVMNHRDELVTSHQGIDELFEGFCYSQEFVNKCRSYGILSGEIDFELPDVPRYITVYDYIDYPEDITTLMDVYIERGLIEEDEVAAIQESLVSQGEYWVEENINNGNPRYVFGGKILTWGCGVDCSGFVTITYRRALGTMIQPNSSVSGSCNNSVNYIQSMHNYGTVNVGGRFYQEYPMDEGVFRTGDRRTVYVDRFGIASPILMNTYQWIYYLKLLGVSYTEVQMGELNTNDDWSFLDSYQAGDIVLWWDGKPWSTTDGDSWHMAFYDGNGGVYQSSSMDTSVTPPEHNNIGVEHSNITHIFPNDHDEQTIIIFHCFPTPEN